jgi:hypothetical protein
MPRKEAGRARAWRRVLYEKQLYPDDYVPGTYSLTHSLL